MIRNLIERYFANSLESYLNATKKIKVCGVPFTIRKISVIDHLEGCKVLFEIFSLYQTNKKKVEENLADKMSKARKHYRDIIMSGVVTPKLSRKDDGEGIHIERILDNWVLATELVEAIVHYTYGKKK